MYRLFLARRYLLSRRVHALATLGVMLGVAALIVVVSIFSGFAREIRAHVHAASADVTVAFRSPCDYTLAAAALAKDPNVAALAPRLAWYGLLHPLPDRQRKKLQFLQGPESNFLALVGIEPRHEVQVTAFARWLADVGTPELRSLDQDAKSSLTLDPSAILISESRLLRLGISRGQRLTLTTGRLVLDADREQSLNDLTLEFVVAGAFSTPHAGFDEGSAFVPIEVLRRLLFPDRPNAVTEITVKLVDATAAAATVSRLREALLAVPGLPAPLVQTWEQQNQVFLSAIDHQKGLLRLVLFVIVVVALFLVFATLSMMVSEKTRDIGTLTALGATPVGILHCFVTSGLALTGLGAVLGVGVGCYAAVQLDGFNRWLTANFAIDLFPRTVYNLKRVPYELDPLYIASVVGVTLALGLVAAGIPALRAARQDPLESLRDE